jgi:hypothetical protein
MTDTINDVAAEAATQEEPAAPALDEHRVAEKVREGQVRNKPIYLVVVLGDYIVGSVAGCQTRMATAGSSAYAATANHAQRAEPREAQSSMTRLCSRAACGSFFGRPHNLSYLWACPGSTTRTT